VPAEEHRVARGGRQQERREVPLHRHEHGEEAEAERERLHRRPAPARGARQQVHGERGGGEQQREAERLHVRDVLPDGPELGRRRPGLEQPAHREEDAHVHERRRGGRPPHAQRPRRRGEHRGERHGRELVVVRRARHVRARVAPHGERAHRDEEPERVRERAPVAAGPRVAALLGGVLRLQRGDGRAAQHERHAEEQHGVRRAEDLDVEAVRGVPPVVERRGGEHRAGAPDAHEGA
jgi:hypothetical protein